MAVTERFPSSAEQIQDGSATENVHVMREKKNFDRCWTLSVHDLKLPLEIVVFHTELVRTHISAAFAAKHSLFPKFRVVFFISFKVKWDQFLPKKWKLKMIIKLTPYSALKMDV